MRILDTNNKRKLIFEFEETDKGIMLQLELKVN